MSPALVTSRSMLVAAMLCGAWLASRQAGLHLPVHWRSVRPWVLTVCLIVVILLLWGHLYAPRQVSLAAGLSAAALALIIDELTDIDHEQR